ncbi:hypothetical protein CHF27_009440 [Romboutsia maritimum]|uniref:Lipoprotein n=1 Tax=Romboutsia maritimum TaxID=2020948 RepID=A0A371IRR4_9FIRM|nr:hypothetical protein [Romboutsia maritimum]RDY23163.1 hypothetical protein CHF27_009440 [Romboutsia maritimum]
MRKSFWSKIIICTVLICCVATCTNSYTQSKQDYISPSLKNVKGYNELKKNLDEIKRIRKNIYTIDINTTDTEPKLKSTKERLNYHLLELKAVKNNLTKFKGVYSNSKDDILFAEQLSFIACSYELSLNQQLNLVEDLISEKTEANKLFFSDNIAHIYYYITLGDQMISYIDSYYVLRK